MATTDIHSRDVLPALSLLLGFLAWPLSRLLIECLVQWYKPSLYKELRDDYETKYMVFFGVLLGLLAKPITLVSCGLAF